VKWFITLPLLLIGLAVYMVSLHSLSGSPRPFAEWWLGTGDFPPRWECGQGWSQNPSLGWFHIVFDLIINTCYLFVGFFIAWWTIKRGLWSLTWLFAVLFFVFCGGNHGIWALEFVAPAYRLEGYVWKPLQAISVIGFLYLAVAVESKRWKNPNQVRVDDALLQSVSDAADPFYFVNTDGRCELINRRCVELLGYDNESQLIGRNMHQAIHYKRRNGSAYPESECHMFHSMAWDEVTHSPNDVVWAKNGEMIPVSWTAVPVKVDDAMIGCRINLSRTAPGDESLEQIADDISRLNRREG